MVTPGVSPIKSSTLSILASTISSVVKTVTAIGTSTSFSTRPRAPVTMITSSSAIDVSLCAKAVPPIKPRLKSDVDVMSVKILEYLIITNFPLNCVLQHRIQNPLATVPLKPLINDELAQFT